MPGREREESSQGALAQRRLFLIIPPALPPPRLLGVGPQEAGFGEKPHWLSAKAMGGQTVEPQERRAAPGLMNFNERRPCSYPNQRLALMTEHAENVTRKSLYKKTPSQRLYRPGTPTLCVSVQKAVASVKSNYFPPVALNRRRFLLKLITLPCSFRF